MTNGLKNLPEKVVEFYELLKPTEVSKQRFLQSHVNQTNIHNHTLENLQLYFNLDDLERKDRVIWFDSMVWLCDNRKHRFFMYGDVFKLYEKYFLFLIQDKPDEEGDKLKSKFIFYANVKQTGLVENIFIEGKLLEISYNIDLIFNDPTNSIFYEKYKNSGHSSKDIKKKIVKCTSSGKIKKLIEEGTVQILDLREEDLLSMEELHKNWVDFKMNDPKVFKMMFSSGRYNKCCHLMYKTMRREDFYSKAVYFNGKVCAVLQVVLDLKNSTSYFVSFFSSFWELPSQFNQQLLSLCLKDLVSLGIKEVNYGMQVDKNLLKFKGHLPYFKKITYKYNFKK